MNELGPLGIDIGHVTVLPAATGAPMSGGPSKTGLELTVGSATLTVDQYRTDALAAAAAVDPALLEGASTMQCGRLVVSGRDEDLARTAGLPDRWHCGEVHEGGVDARAGQDDDSAVATGVDPDTGRSLVGASVSDPDKHAWTVRPGKECDSEYGEVALVSRAARSVRLDVTIGLFASAAPTSAHPSWHLVATGRGTDTVAPNGTSDLLLTFSPHDPVGAEALRCGVLAAAPTTWS